MDTNFRRFFTACKLLTDGLIVIAAFCLGYIGKFKLYWFGLGGITPTANFPEYWEVMIYIEILWLFAFAYAGMYRYYQGPVARVRETAAVCVGVFLGVVEVMAFSFLYPTFPGSRYVLVYAGVAAVILLSLSRWLIAKLIIFLHQKGRGNKRAVIVGSSQTAQRIAEKLLQYPEYGFHYCGFITDRRPRLIHALKKKFVRLGGFKNFRRIFSQKHITAVFADDLPAEKLAALAEYCRQKNLYFRYHSEALSKNIFWEELDAVDLIGLKTQKFREVNKIIKRVFDLALVLPALLVLSPVMLLIALGIKLTSPGPIIYRQTRVTYGGRHFHFLKFRSMPVNSEKSGPILSIEDQKHRATKFGYFLRKTSLDELPQLFNVLKGDMSIVGPRPERPIFHEEYLRTIPRWEERLAVKGGITGWAQLNGRSELTALPQEKLEYDIYYIENWSVLFDIMLLLRTLGYVLRQRDVY
ncbi:undecaprenyl-phosphate glucose phosphotransferase [Candidatus Termititenax persephonae]|uniref:Undecaprenyl-phosphate glucose phosphotransferase n=1 Tax=Candidatus Termititenax persephonae TaxID=2218525 RepID=A0A388TGX4_9BACT|nr:undecaprenyl-phosphate glucose phosphotransferase [Candidatus Termititenax persephonae]